MRPDQEPARGVARARVDAAQIARRIDSDVHACRAHPGRQVARHLSHAVLAERPGDEARLVRIRRKCSAAADHLPRGLQIHHVPRYVTYPYGEISTGM